MKFTEKELTYICQIMEVKNVVGFDLNKMLDQEEIKEVEKGLEEKGILLDDTLTKYGLTILEIVSLYINASVFYKFGENTIFGQYEEKEYSMIKKEEEQFDIELINQEMLIATIFMKYKNWEEIKEGEYRKRFISKEKMSEFIKENKEVEGIFYYKVDIEKQKEEKGMLFIVEGYLQHYKASSGELDMYSRKEVQKGIESIFSREE